jgi:flagellin
MALVINTNTASITAQRHLTSSRAEMEQAMERLSSGKRINSAMDDAAGLTIAHSLDSRVTSLNMAARNANDGISLINLAEGALEEVTTMIIRMRELTVESLNGTYSWNDRANLQLEMDALADEITRISDNTFFNGLSPIGASGTEYTFQVGFASSDTITVTGLDMAAEALGSGSTHATSIAALDISGTTSGSITYASAATEMGIALLSLDDALNEVDNYRARLGATANRLEFSANNLYSRVEAQSAARSRIEDADYAVESANLARAQVLQQAGTAMLSQANATTQNVLSLLK